MLGLIKTSAVALALLFTLGCSDDATGSSTSSTSSAGGATSSTDTTAQTGGSGGGGVGGQGGTGGGPTAKQLAQADALGKYVDALYDRSSWPVAFDAAALKTKESAVIFGGDGGDAVFFRAMHDVHLAVPEGHQDLRSTAACTTPAFYNANTSRFGVCARPHGDDLVITSALEGNPLGLSAGDLITKAGDDSGPDLIAAAIRRPFCGDVAPSDSGTRTFAAASFFGTVPVGMELTVHPVDGSADHTVTIPSQNGKVLSCQDPLGRDIDFDAQATMRPDGVAVIRIPRFYPLNGSLPANPTQEQVDQFTNDFQQKILDQFNTVKNAKAIVWDARGNYGGLTLVGLAIVNGMPSAQTTAISYCNQRVAKSHPSTYSSQKYAIYGVAPGGPFAFSGKVAVLVDGLDYSAADYFPLAVHKGTSVPLVGTPSAGAFGGPGPEENLAGTPAMEFDIDVNHCLDAQTNQPLETHSATPDVVVEYDPADLAKGADTVLEAGVAQVLE